jgi:hypothetical protein
MKIWSYKRYQHLGKLRQPLLMMSWFEGVMTLSIMTLSSATFNIMKPDRVTQIGINGIANWDCLKQWD